MPASKYVLLALLASGGVAAPQTLSADAIVQPNGGALPLRFAATGEHFPKGKLPVKQTPSSANKQIKIHHTVKVTHAPIKSH